LLTYYDELDFRFVTMPDYLDRQMLR